jgi:uncharacterized membrane protein YkvA (DUF1232 family)
VWLLLIVLLFALGRGRDAREIARFVPDCLVLFKRLFRDPRVPRRAKAVVVFTIGYLALPFDLIPDFIPVVGQTDDAVLVALAIAFVVRKSGPDLVSELWPGSTRGLSLLLSLSRSRPN